MDEFILIADIEVFEFGGGGRSVEIDGNLIINGNADSSHAIYVTGSVIVETGSLILRSDMTVGGDFRIPSRDGHGGFGATSGSPLTGLTALHRSE